MVRWNKMRRSVSASPPLTLRAPPVLSAQLQNLRVGIVATSCQLVERLGHKLAACVYDGWATSWQLVATMPPYNKSSSVDVFMIGESRSLVHRSE